MTQQRHLFIGIPTRDGDMTVELHRYLSSLEVCAATGTIPFTVNVAIVSGLSPVHFARNVLAQMALEQPGHPDDLVCQIDADMLPDPSASRLFFYNNLDIVVPRMFRFRHNGPDGYGEDANKPPEIACCATIINEKGRFDLIPEKDASGVHAVHAAGTGFIVMKRKVLEDPRMRVGPNEDGVPALFRMTHTSTGRILDWEDVDFTHRATQLGYLCAVDFGARCGHRKTINLDAVAEMVYGNKPKNILDDLPEPTKTMLVDAMVRRNEIESGLEKVP